MDAAKRKVIEAAGWKVGGAADFLEMSDQERQLLDTRVKLALAIRQQREALHLSQKQLAALLKTSQPRVAKIERAASDVSMDQLIRAFMMAGGKIEVKTRKTKTKKRQRASNSMETLILESISNPGFFMRQARDIRQRADLSRFPAKTCDEGRSRPRASAEKQRRREAKYYRARDQYSRPAASSLSRSAHYEFLRASGRRGFTGAVRGFGHSVFSRKIH